MNGNIKDKIINLVIEYDIKKDYFGNKNSINIQVNNWKNQKEKGDETALSYTEEDIINHYTTILSNQTIDRFLEVAQQIIDKKREAKELLRYDNIISLEFFTIITDIPTKGLSNKKLKPILDVYFGI